MVERVSATARLARGFLGVVLSAASESSLMTGRGGGGSEQLKAAAEMVLSGGRARAAAAMKPPAATAAAASVSGVSPAVDAARRRADERNKAAAADTFRSPPPSASVVPPPTPQQVAPKIVAIPTPAPDGTSSAPTETTTTTATASASTSTSTSTSTSATSDPPSVAAAAANQPKQFERRSVEVPASPLARVLGFGQLAAGLAAGTISESARRAWNGNGGVVAGAGSEGGGGGLDTDGPLIGGGSVFMTEANAERLAVALCRMRGAALKLGQMLSIQDESVIPPQIQRALERVRQGADTMPAAQLHRAIEDHLGSGWRDKLSSFDEEPLAAASIGQVHKAVYTDASTGAVKDVCMKIQYPGVARSIHSDIDNLMRLVSLTDLLPRGLYVEHAVKVAKAELTLECDYEYEAKSQKRMAVHLRGDKAWNVPNVIDALCSKGVLTTEFAPGMAIDKAVDLPQEERDYIGSELLRLTLRELFEFRFMQTDPNFANFLYDSPSRQLTLIDFGAAKDFPKQFVDDYLRMVIACAEKDRKGLVDSSIALGFLTGEESEVLIDAHCEAGFQVGKPFAFDGSYDFATNRDMTRRVAGLGKVMLKHRLTPPPQDAYSLHRKLSGSFLACMRIGAKVPARQMLRDAYDKYVFGPLPETFDVEDAALGGEHEQRPAAVA